MTETQLLKLFLGAATKALPSVRLFRRTQGEFLTLDGRNISVVYAPGACDVAGFTKEGRAIELEFKSKHGRLSDAQKSWRDCCKRFRVLWLELKAQRGEEPAATVERWVRELEAALQVDNTPR